MNKYIVGMTVIAFLFAISAVHAQTATASWDSSTYYQGDGGTLTVTVYNSHSYQICPKQVYLQFDWQQAQNTVYPSPNTACIATGQSQQFVISFGIPSSTTIEQHLYNVKWIDNGILIGSPTLSSGSLMVHDAYEKVYLNLVSTVQPSITQAQNSNYQSPTAVTDLNQAVSYFNQAATLAGQGQYQGAVNNLNQAQASLSAAITAEQSYQPPLLGGGKSNLNIGGGSGSPDSGIGIIVVIIIIIVVAAFWLNKKKAQPKSKAKSRKK
ncbi:MAG: hypothetical protein NT120_03135 [Candidatus Aenigmarchaeota archaeon]|nr:hypothetical protein [Candidatus Aenigmarchaeota archaeon]